MHQTWGSKIPKWGGTLVGTGWPKTGQIAVVRPGKFPPGHKKKGLISNGTSLEKIQVETQLL